MWKTDRLRPVIDLDVCIEHCEWVVRQQADGLFAIRVLTDNSQGDRALTATQFFDNRSPLFRDEVALFLRRNCHHSAHVFYSVNSFKEPIARANLASPGRLLHVDADEVSLPPRGPRPSRIVESSPGNHHFIYVLDRPVIRFKAESLSKALQQLVGGDKGGQSVAKLLRLPGTFNAKHHGSPVRIVESTDAIYTFDSIWSFLPVTPPKPKLGRIRKGAISQQLSIAMPDLLARLRLGQKRIYGPFAVSIGGKVYRYAGDDRSQIVFQIALSLAGANWPRERIALTVADTVFWKSREADGKTENMDRLINKALAVAEELWGSREK